MSPKLNWGADEKDFPLLQFDDFDGQVIQFEYEAGDYGCQIRMRIEPADYETAARDVDLAEGTMEGRPGDWYSMGGNEDTYQISDDGYSVEGPMPNRNTRATKVILAFRETLKVKLRGGSIKAIDGIECHFKAREESSYNRETKETRVRFILYPVGKVVGHSVFGEGLSANESKGESGESKEEGAETETDTKQESTGGRRRRQTTTTAPPPGEGEQTDNGVVDEVTLETATPLILAVVQAAGEDGVSTRQFASKASQFEEDYPEAVITFASKRSTITSAVSAGIVDMDDGKLFIPQE